MSPAIAVNVDGDHEGLAATHADEVQQPGWAVLTTVREATARLGVELMAARARGDVVRGGQEADDARGAVQWLDDIGSQLLAAKLAVRTAGSGVALGESVMVDQSDLDRYRLHLMTAAELALSAVESFDRLAGPSPAG